MAKRFLGAAFVIVFVGLGFFFGGFVLELLLMGASVLGLYELTKTTGFCQNKALRITAYAVTALLFIYRFFKSLKISGLGFLNQITYEKVIFLTLCIFLSAVAVVFLFRFEKAAPTDVPSVVFSFVYAPVLFSMMGEIRMREAHGLLMCGFLILPFVTDVFAYFFGRWFGKKHPLPVLSPNKTVAGFIGGFLGGILVGGLYAWLFNGLLMERTGLPDVMSVILYGMLIGFLAALFGEMGDLFSSAIKRKAGIKDFGTLIPGHGGIIDRFDSILLWAPVLYFVFG